MASDAEINIIGKFFRRNNVQLSIANLIAITLFFPHFLRTVKPVK